MRRRHLPALLASTPALAQGPAMEDAALAEAVRIAAALPGDSAVLIEASGPKGSLRAGHRVDAPIFVGSCVKTFILAAWLLEVEAGRLSLSEALRVDDTLRAPVSPVLGGLTGTMAARPVLEAMIAHSDNTATDIALHRVGVEKVRALIGRMGLAGTRVPESTRIMVSTLAGAPPGEDLGWAGIQRLIAGPAMPGQRPVLNPYQTMASTAQDMCRWYAAVLAGQIFASAAGLAEFKRISTMADAMPLVAPPDVMAYGKGGSIDWNGVQALAVAGQMVDGPVRANFFWGANWPGEPDSVPPVLERLTASIRAALARAIAVLA